MIRTLVAWVVVGVLLLWGAGVAIADSAKPATRMSRDLADLTGQRALTTRADVPADDFVELPFTVAGDWVTIDAVAAGNPKTLEAELIALGARDTAVAGRLVSARLPVAAVPFLEAVASLQFARPAHRVLNVGDATSQGDKVIRADVARASGVDGTGVKVGVLSDSFNCLSGADDDMASGDLPSTVTVLQEDPGCGSGSDEGRAMLQIVHDVAPGASLAFATTEGGQAGFANNIRALRTNGARVIVDDVLYLAEPMFQDGVVAQAVDEVTAAGVAYFSSAGNNGRRAYDHAFVPGQFLAPGTFGSAFLGGTPHNFGTSIMQRISSPGGSRFTLALQWDSPFFSVGGAPGTQNDLDVYLLRQNLFGGFSVVAAATSNDLASGDPFESLGPISCNAPSSSRCVGFIVIVVHAGPNPGRLKYVLFTSGGTPTLTPPINSGSIYGHANAQGAMAIGAANYKTPTTLETFSSGGTTPVLFDTSGDLLPTPDPRQFKPELVAPSGVDTTFFGGGDTDNTGFPNFSGTSAAAPHAAGVAALLRQALPTLTPAGLRTVLQSSALNMGPAGFDNNTGFGLIQADKALGALHQLAITAGPSGTPNPVKPGGTVSLGVTATDTFDHTLAFAWTATCSGGLPPGTFDNATLAAPKWTASVNGTGASQTCALKVTVSDGQGLSKSGTHTQTVLSVARVLSVKPASAPVGTTVVITGASLTDATLVRFSGPVGVVPTAVTATSLQAVVPEGARTGVISITTPAGVGPSTSLFKVLPRITGFTPGQAVAGSVTPISVSGTNLQALTGARVLKIGAFTVPPGSIVSSTPTLLTFRVPLGAVTGKIGVTTVDGAAVSATDLTVVQPPRATAFAPPAAAVGASVKITGTNLLGASLVTFGGGATAVPTAVTATSLQVVVPEGALTGPVSITNATGTAASVASFKVLPAIMGFTPSSAVGGSAIVDVTGKNLRAATGEPVVKVGTLTVPPGSIVSSTPTLLRFRVPLGAVTGKIGVTTLDGAALSATALTVVQPPRATAFAPAAGVPGTPVKITGTNLLGASLVTFSGGATAAPAAVTATSLQVVVPAGALAGPVSVTSPVGTGASAAIFKVLPAISSFTPGQAVAGSPEEIAVSGTALRAATGEPGLKIGAFTVPPGSIVSSTPTLLKFRVPLGAVTGKIGVTTIGGAAVSATNLTVVQPPRATAFAPASGLAGTPVKITGTNLTGATLVTFGGGASAEPTAVTATSLQVVVPPGALTGPVSITNAIGTAASVASFKVPPAIAAFTPPSAVGGSATIVEVTGTNLRAATGEPVVKVGAFTVPPGSIVSSTPALLRFRVPLGAVTGKIGVTTLDGAALSATALTVVQPPRPTAFAPAVGVPGTSVKITGTNLTGATLVTFSGGAPAVPAAVTATSLQVVVPAAAATGPVSITNAIGTGASAVVFKVLPKITSFTPAVASLGSSVVVTGTNLKAGADPVVKVGAVEAAVVASSPTTVTFTVPALAVTGTISITTADGTAVSAAPLTVTP